LSALVNVNDSHHHVALQPKVVSNNHNNAAIIISSLCKNIKTHKLIASHKIYSLLLTLRHSKDTEARRLSMETLLTLLENKDIHPFVRDDVDLAQTLAAITKFGASKHIKQRSTKIIKTMLGNKAYFDMMGIKQKDKNKKHNFARARTMKSPVKSQKENLLKSPQKIKPMSKTKSWVETDHEKMEILKNELTNLDQKIFKKEEEIGINEQEEMKKEIADDEQMNVIIPKEQMAAIEREINDEITTHKVSETQSEDKKKPDDFWHDESEKLVRDESEDKSPKRLQTM